MLQAAADGIGCALLLCYLADTQKRLARVTPPVDVLTTKLWRLIHPDLRHVARIRALREIIIEAFAQPVIVQRLTGAAERWACLSRQSVRWSFMPSCEATKPTLL